MLTPETQSTISMYKTTSAKTRFKSKSNDQNRSQYFTWSTFNQTRKSPQKDQNQIIMQSHQMINVKQRQAMWSKLDIKDRKSKSKQKSIQWSWNFIYEFIMLRMNIMQKIRSRRAQMIGKWKCTNATSNMWHKLSHHMFMCPKQWWHMIKYSNQSQKITSHVRIKHVKFQIHWINHEHFTNKWMQHINMASYSIKQSQFKIQQQTNHEINATNN